MWPRIYEHQPKASLHIYCDVNHKWSNDVEPEKMQNIKMLFEKYDAYNHGMNIYYHGWVNKKILANAWLTADIWFYPCTFMETFCLTALEAAATKTLAITNHLAALQNTGGNRGIIIKGDATTEKWHEKALKKIFKVMDSTDDKMKNILIEANYDWAKELSWENRANILLDKFILKDKFEYKGMYNWTHDLPQGHKQYFLGVIDYFNTNYKKKLSKNGETLIKVLEIGTYTGISLINILSLITNSVGVGVDMWSNYTETGVDGLHNNITNLEVEKSFHNNVKLAGMSERVKAVKGDSIEILMNMIKSDDKYDFIYVDGSHLALDCYCDLLLSWELLNVGGVFAIDDYLYTQNTSFESPFEGVNRFLQKYEGKYKILHKNYRVFLEKL